MLFTIDAIVNPAPVHPPRIEEETAIKSAVAPSQCLPSVVCSSSLVSNLTSSLLHAALHDTGSVSGEEN